MSDIKRFNDKDVAAAVKVVEQLLREEDLVLVVEPATYDDCKSPADFDNLFGQNIFKIAPAEMPAYVCDYNNGYPLHNLGEVVECLSVVFGDKYYGGFEERIDAGEEIPPNDAVRKVIMFFESEFCRELLSKIDADVCLKHKDVEIDNIGLNDGEQERYIKDGTFDCVGYLCDKSIATAILNTEPEYPYVEFENSIFVSAHADWYDNAQQMLDELQTGEDCFCNNYSSYGSLIETEQYQVRDDMFDLGLYDSQTDEWNFYLSENEIIYIGLGNELERYKDEEAKAAVDIILSEAGYRSFETTGGGVASKDDFEKEHGESF